MVPPMPNRGLRPTPELKLKVGQLFEACKDIQDPTRNLPLFAGMRGNGTITEVMGAISPHLKSEISKWKSEKDPPYPGYYSTISKKLLSIFDGKIPRQALFDPNKYSIIILFWQEYH